MTGTRVAIVGLGAVSFEHLAKLVGRPGVRVVGLCDLERTLARAVCERFGVAAPYDDFDLMLQETSPDVVHVLTPPAAHCELTLAALRAGAHVLVEKPIAPSWSEYARMRDEATSRGLILCENYNYCFMTGVLRAEAAWRAGRIGDVVNVDVSFGGVMSLTGPYGDRNQVHFAHGLPGGALQNFVSHPVSLALSFMDSCTAVTSVERRLEPGFPSNDELRALLSGPRQCAVISVSGHANPSHLTLGVQGTRGRLDVNVYSGQLRIGTDGSMIRQGVRDGLQGLRASALLTARAAAGRRDAFEGLGTLLDRFYAAVDGREPPPVSTEQMDAVNGVVRDLFAGGAATCEC